jgi:hypothetical protein
MEYSRFAVDTKPYCVWDPELRAQEQDFVQRLDPSYFEFLAAAYASQQGEPDPTGGDDAAAVPMHAALALRTAYVHAAETLLALLLGSVQAPDCLLGWMHLYQPADLRSMIKKIDGYERFPSKLNATRVTWEQVAAAVFSPLVLDDKEQEARIERNFADLWRHIAREWSRQDTASEYNSIKHGLRIHAGGFRLAMGVEDQPGERADPASMRSFGGSRYGSSYYELRPIAGRRHRGVTRSSHNWRVEEAYVGLTLIAQSIANLVPGCSSLCTASMPPACGSSGRVATRHSR